MSVTYLFVVDIKTFHSWFHHRVVLAGKAAHALAWWQIVVRILTRVRVRQLERDVEDECRFLPMLQSNS